jgi:uncharacterized protein YeaO (DUF488 family)
VTVSIKRVYDDPAPDDGYRVLVDRLWPRGLSKARADVDLWLGDVAPSPELRTWWNHDPDRLAEFAKRYRSELDGNGNGNGNGNDAIAIAELRTIIAEHPIVTLSYGARDPRVNHAAVLLDYLSEPRSTANTDEQA